MIAEATDNLIEAKCMQFRLLYSGRLLGASRNSTRAEHKAQIRNELSPQLERLDEQLHEDPEARVPRRGFLLSITY